MRRKGQISTDHQPRRTTARRDRVLEAQLHRYAEAVKAAIKNGSARPNFKDYEQKGEE